MLRGKALGGKINKNMAGRVVNALLRTFREQAAVLEWFSVAEKGDGKWFSVHYQMLKSTYYVGS